MGFFRRLANLFKGFLSLFIGGIEKANPKALLETHIMEFQKNQATFNTNLAKQDALRRRLEIQVKKDATKEKQLITRIRALIKAGKKDLAGTLAGQRKLLQANLAENTAQLDNAESQYQTLSRQRDVFVKEGMTKIEKIKGMMSQAEMAEAQAKLTEMASDLTFDPNGGGLSDLEASLENRITEAQGQTRVAADAASGNAWSVSEVEMEMVEADALAEFASEFGLDEPEPDILDDLRGETEAGATAKAASESAKTL